MEFLSFKSDYSFIDAKLLIIDLSHIFSALKQTNLWTPYNSINLYVWFKKTLIMLTIVVAFRTYEFLQDAIIRFLSFIQEVY